MGLPAAFFCSQECFKSGWAFHKLVHNPPKPGKVDERFAGYKFTGKVRPGVVGPMRPVPSEIPTPDYATTLDGSSAKEQALKNSSTVVPKTTQQIAALKKAGRIAAEVLEIGAAAVKVGITTDEIDRIVHEACISRGSYPSPLNYYGFPKSCCTSVNEVICHGIPDSRPLENGDIVNLDITVFVDGVHADVNATYPVGTVDADSLRLVACAKRSLNEAIVFCKPGMLYRDIGTVISKVVKAEGFSVVRTYCGHGIGDLFHCPPSVPHYDKNKAVGTMQVGHVFTIEPMINAGGWQDQLWPDNWTDVTKDGSRSAQFEHTLLVTETGVEILTKL